MYRVKLISFGVTQRGEVPH